VKAKVIVKWGLAAIIAFSGLTAWMAYQSERVSKHEYKWQNDYKRFGQEIPFKRCP